MYFNFRTLFKYQPNFQKWIKICIIYYYQKKVAHDIETVNATYYFESCFDNLSASQSCIIILSF